MFSFIRECSVGQGKYLKEDLRKDLHSGDDAKKLFKEEVQLKSIILFAVNLRAILYANSFENKLLEKNRYWH